MTERSKRQTQSLAWLAFGCSLLTACGPSASQLRAQKDASERQHELAEQRQYNVDLKVRMQIVESRNRVLTDLVHGLTADLQRASGADPAPAELPAAHASLAALNHDVAQLVSSVHQSQSDLQTLRSERDALEAQLTNARLSIENTRAEEAAAAQRRDAFRLLQSQVAPLVTQGALELRVSDNRVRLSLPARSSFRAGDAALSRDGELTLQRVADVLRQWPNREFQVEAQASDAARSKRFATPLELAAARALLVVQFLVARGVPAEHLSAASVPVRALTPVTPATPTLVSVSPAADGGVVAAPAPSVATDDSRLDVVLVPRADELPDLSSLQASPPASPPP